MCRSIFTPTSSTLYTFLFFFFNDTATTEIYTLSLHDALPIFLVGRLVGSPEPDQVGRDAAVSRGGDRKSTRLNSSHVSISYAVFCLKKKKVNNRRLGDYVYADVIEHGLVSLLHSI